MELKLQNNEHRCAFTEHEHLILLPRCCPVSGNPEPGSMLSISYKGTDGFLEVQSLWDFIQSYKGGKGEVRSMEGMLQEIAQACANTVHVEVTLKSELCINPSQTMKVTCYAFPEPYEDLFEVRQNKVDTRFSPDAQRAKEHKMSRLRARTEKTAKTFGICHRERERQRRVKQ